MSSTKERIIQASAELFRRQGFAGTGLKQVVAQARAQFGSIYHFFPGGKEELGEAVIRESGRFYLELVAAVMDAAPDIVSGVEAVFIGGGETLLQTDFADACPIATVALEVASTSEPLRIATADVFDSWIDACTARFVAGGIADARARELAIMLIGALEGGFMLSRSLRSIEPMRVAGATTAAAVRAALAAHPDG